MRRAGLLVSIVLAAGALLGAAPSTAKPRASQAKSRSPHRLCSARRRPGIVSGLFLVGYAAARMSGELFRQPDVQLGFLVFGTTMGQLLSIPLLIAGILLGLWAWRRPIAAAGPRSQAAGQ